MNRLERLYAITEEIRRRAPNPVSAAALSEEFGVSRRTVERDLASLRAAGVPLFGEHGRTGGQRTLAAGSGGGAGGSSRTVVLALSTAEVTALIMALATAGSDMPFNENGVTAAKRLLDGLPDATRISVETLRSKIRTGAPEEPTTGSRARARARRTVEEAVRRQVVVNIDYADRNGVTTRRSVDPVGFHLGSGGWYLIGWCHLRGAGRVFRLDRITSARLTRKATPDRNVDETLGWVPGETTAP